MGSHLRRLRATDMWSTIETLCTVATPEDLAVLRTEPSCLEEVMQVIRKYRPLKGIDYMLARKIMGSSNFFGPELWIALYGEKFSKKQLREIADFPWDEEILNERCKLCGKAVKECHFAFLGLEKLRGHPLILDRWVILQPQEFALAWTRPVTESICEFRWYLVHKKTVSAGLWGQKELDKVLPIMYEMPRAIVEVTKHILYHRKNNAYLDSGMYAYCDDRTSDFSQIYVGSSRSGIIINYVHETDPFPPDCGIGIAASLKYPVNADDIFGWVKVGASPLPGPKNHKRRS
ncbi:hypothetical protein MYX06_02470 [Patescibacteria group bacterium AH-259-L05]|nr:hypothetical protein [Patescibacteria group bacterium AH-259-L05]